MPPRDRLAALKLMDRINRHEMESIGAQLAALRQQQSEIEAQKEALTATAIQEASDSTAETRVYLPGYLTSVDTQQRRWSHEQDELEQQAVLAEAELFQAFRASKTNDAVLGRVMAEIALEDERKETAQMDDAGRALYALRQANSNIIP